MKNIAVPATISIFSIIIIYLALDIETSPPMIVGDSMQPRAFPIFLMVLNLVLSFLLMWQGSDEVPKKRAPLNRTTIGSLVLFPLFYILTTYIDILIGLAAVLFLMSFFWGERRIWVAAAVGLITPAALFFLFTYVLSIRFPRGMITNIFYG